MSHVFKSTEPVGNLSTPWRYAFRPCGYVIAQNVEFNGQVFIALRLHVQQSHYLALILIDYLVQCIWHNLNCSQWKRSLHSRWNFISTELHRQSDEHWPTEVTSNTYFYGVGSVHPVPVPQSPIKLIQNKWNSSSRSQIQQPAKLI